MKPHVVLSIPKWRGRKLTHVVAKLEDWTVFCDDAEIKAELEKLRPENLGYLPFQERVWATLAERWLVADIVSVHPPPSDYSEIPGVRCSGDHC